MNTNKSLKDISDNITKKNFKRLSLHSYNDIRLYASDARFDIQFESESLRDENIRKRAIFKRISIALLDTNIGLICMHADDRHTSLNRISGFGDINNSLEDNSKVV